MLQLWSNSLIFALLSTVSVPFTLIRVLCLSVSSNGRYPTSWCEGASAKDIAPTEKLPKAIVVTQGDVARTVEDLMLDFRQVMLPHTADKLKVG
jgi:hypothetical protein